MHNSSRRRQPYITRQWRECKTLSDATAPDPSANSIELRLSSPSSSKDTRMLLSVEPVTMAPRSLKGMVPYFAEADARHGPVPDADLQ